MKIAIISDTHNKHSKLNIPEVDCIIHTGDFTSSILNNREEMNSFLDWFAKLNIKYKILVPGNHELNFEYLYKTNNLLIDKSIICLIDKSIKIEGIKFYGTPWSETFEDWGFFKTDKEMKEILEKIDKDTDILITHTPQFGILDLTDELDNVGSKLLKEKIKSLNLKYHVFGHIHEDRGEMKGKYTSINASNYYNFDNIFIINTEEY